MGLGEKKTSSKFSFGILLLLIIFPFSAISIIGTGDESAHGNVQFSWESTWGASSFNFSDFDMGCDIAVNSDKLYVVMETHNISGFDAGIIRFNNLGQIDWYKLWDNGSAEIPHAIVYHSGYLYITGFADSNPDYPFLIKYQTNGTMVWETVWNTPVYSRSYDLLVTDNYVTIVGVYNRSLNYDYNQILVIQYDLDGNQQWNNTYSITGLKSKGYSITGDSNSLYIAGDYNATQGDYNRFLIKLNMQGSIQWTKTYGVTGYDEFLNDVMLYNNRIYSTGRIHPHGTDDYAFLTLCYTSDGSLLWHATWDGDDFDRDPKLAVYDTYLIVAGTSGFGYIEGQGTELNPVIVGFTLETGQFLGASHNTITTDVHERMKSFVIAGNTLYGVGHKEVNTYFVSDLLIVKFTGSYVPTDENPPFISNYPLLVLIFISIGASLLKLKKVKKNAYLK